MSVVAAKYIGTKAFLIAYALLIERARQGKTVSYKEIAEIMGLPPSGNHMGQETGHLVGEISQEEHQYGRPLLSAIVVRDHFNTPGAGFHDMAIRLGVMPRWGDEFQRNLFWREEMQRVYEEWGR